MSEFTPTPIPFSITLQEGPNYVSFPATSNSTFGTIFPDLMNCPSCPNGSSYFYVFNPIVGNFLSVDWSEYIQKNVGYYVEAPSTKTWVYDGIEYQSSFDEIKSNLMIGWNLVGAGSNNITIHQWCAVWDPSVGNIPVPTGTINSGKAYWINSNQCVQPTISGATLFIVGALSSVLVLYVTLKGLKWI